MAKKKKLVDQDFNQNEIQNAVDQNLATAPSSPKEGQFYWNTATKQDLIYNGTDWVDRTNQGIIYQEGGGIDITNSTISVDIASGVNAGNVTLTTTNGLAGSVAEASTTTKGIIEIATDTEASTGTATGLAVTPKQLGTKVDKLADKPTSGTYTKVSINGEGQVTEGANLSASDIPSITLSKISDVTASASEVNILDGVTASTSEINILDGITASTTELNYVDGVTSSIQTQLDNKVVKNTAITGATHTKITYDSKGLVTSGSDLQASDIPNLSLSKITDVTATASEVNVLDGITATTTELNYTDGVTSNIQTQLNNKLATKPDGTHDLIDSADKITLSYMPDVVLGQMLFAGTFVPSTAVATLSTNAKTKLGTSSNTITLTNNTTAITGYEANEGNYYICSADGSFASISFLTGDWLLSTGTEWTKIDNTDAVTGIKGNAENTYRIGNVNITADNVLPTQTSNSGKFLTTNVTTASWGTVPDTLPTQTGNSGKFLTTNGTTPSWATVDALPSQTGESGKFLTTDGTDASWSVAVTPSGTQTLTNKTIDADDNTISDLAVGNFKSGVIVTTVGSTGSDSSLPTEQGVREAITSATSGMVTTTGTQTLTNKSIDADNNTISDLTVSNLKSGVLQTTVRAVASASDTAIASEKAIASGLASKQNTLTEGTNITISGDTISATDTTYSNGTGLDLTGTTFSLKTAGANQLGGIKVGSNLSIDANGVLSADAQSITVDSALSSTSTNPVQNKVVKSAIDGKSTVTFVDWTA